MLSFSIKSIKYTTIFLSVIICLLLFKVPLEVYGRIFNQSKEKELNSYLAKEHKDLIILTVTGDMRYKNSKLQTLYKNLQIIHVLVISASNILLLLNFIHIFIYRKNKTSYLLTLTFIYLYGRFISFPETFIRSIQTIAVSKLSNNTGMKFSKIREAIFLLITYFITYNWFKLGDSYRLSFIYSTVITTSTFVSNKFFKSKIAEFLFLSFNLTVTSSILFNLNNFSSICTTFIANIFITLLYDIAIYLAYIIYLLPSSILSDTIKTVIKTLFDGILSSLNLLSNLTYNICNE